MIVYLVIINIIGYMFMAADKERAKANQWRIPETTLLGIAVLGGSLGVWIAMNTFRHKTKHPKFQQGVPLIFMVQCAILFYFVYA